MRIPATRFGRGAEAHLPGALLAPVQDDAAAAADGDLDLETLRRPHASVMPAALAARGR